MQPKRNKQNINFFFVVCICCFHSCCHYQYVFLFLSSSSCLIYSHIQMMPSLYDNHYSLYLSVKSYIERKETFINPSNSFYVSFSTHFYYWLFDNNNIDYNKRAITTSIRNVERKKEKKSKKKTSIKKESFSGIHILCHYAVYVCLCMDSSNRTNRNISDTISDWLIGSTDSFFSFCIYLYIYVLTSSIQVRLSFSFFFPFLQASFCSLHLSDEKHLSQTYILIHSVFYH